MWGSIFRIALATIAFAGIHSFFASNAVKNRVSKKVGARNRNAFYRPFFIMQSVVTSGALLVYGMKLPDREIYHIRGILAAFFRLGQVLSLVYLARSARSIGISDLTGVSNIRSWWSGAEFVLPEPEAQGPGLDAKGRLNIDGPFKKCRHPLNFGGLPFLWLFPRMTSNLLTFNLLTSFYLYLGSIHEEKRLMKRYQKLYKQYKTQVAGFFIPSWTKLSSQCKCECLKDVGQE